MSKGLLSNRARPAHFLLVVTILLASHVVLANECMPTIRVGLVHNLGRLTSLTLTSSNEFQIKDAAGSLITAKAGESVTLALNKGIIQVLRAGEQPLTVTSPVRLEPVAREENQLFEIVVPDVRYNRYRGVLEISGGQRLYVINELDLEQYVSGVVPVEIPSTFHPEAQKALAVAARTYALKNSSRHKVEGFDVCDSTHCQGFCGACKEFQWVQKVVQETWGQVVLYDGKPISACYSADCGGATMNAEDYSPSAKLPYLRSVADNPSGKPWAVASQEALSAFGTVLSSEPLSKAGGNGGTVMEKPEANQDANPPLTDCDQTNDYCARSPHHSWQVTYTREELSAKLKAWNGQIGGFETIEVAEFDGSGRIKTVVLKGNKGECRISGARLREILGLNKMKSTRAVISVSADGSLTFSGKGYGHGLGLCMYGADGLARYREGITYVDILKHYYTGVEVKQLSDILP